MPLPSKLRVVAHFIAPFLSLHSSIHRCHRWTILFGCGSAAIGSLVSIRGQISSFPHFQFIAPIPSLRSFFLFLCAIGVIGGQFSLVAAPLLQALSCL